MRDDDEILLLLALGWLLMSGNRPQWDGAWVFPVPDIAGAGDVGRARVTSGFVKGKHNGVDIMFYRAVGDPNDPGAVHYEYYAPEGTPVLAARDGVIYQTGGGPRGYWVVIDHGKPWATFYQHLAEPALLAKGDRVVAGQQIGVMGADPTDPQHLRHLHFETWFQGGADAAVDPGVPMSGWPHNEYDAGGAAP